jgi:hypothetical protein
MNIAFEALGKRSGRARTFDLDDKFPVRGAMNERVAGIASRSDCAPHGGRDRLDAVRQASTGSLPEGPAE